MRIETFGDAVLYCGDNREVFPLIGRVDAVVTDPPYGIRADENPVKGIQRYEKTAWDRERPPRETFEAILACSDEQIIWGGNYFTDFVPPSMQWLIWNKDVRNFSLADFEMAWSSQHKAARVFTLSRGAANQDGKEHPTQKPLALMKWCIELLPEPKTIFDPFMGSGTTGVAAIKLGRKFFGAEMNETYFDVCCRRIEEAVNDGGGLFNL